jgi:hypothetical protein
MIQSGLPGKAAHLLAQLGTNPLFALLCAGSLPLLWVIERRALVWLIVVLAGAATFGLEYFWVGPTAPYFASGFLAFVGAIGLVAAVVLGLRAFQNRNALRLLGAFFLVAVLTALSGFYLRYSGAATPITFDRVVAFADQQFGFQPAFSLGRFFISVPVAGNASFVAYNGLLFALLLLFAIRYAKQQRSAEELLFQFALAGVAGIILYSLLPVCGPVYAFPLQFPLHEPTLNLSTAIAGALPPAPRNGVPSLHLSWALILFFGSLRENRAIRAMFALSLLGTILATMGLGEHYLTDLIVAVPLACAVASLRFDSGHGAVYMLFQAFGLGACTVAWMVVLRFEPAAILVPHRMIAAALATVIGPICWFYRTRHTGDLPPQVSSEFIPRPTRL